MYKGLFACDAGEQNQVVVEAIAHEAIAKGKMRILEMGTSGLTTAGIAAAGQVVQPCVAIHDVASGARGSFCVAGTCEILNDAATTAGHGITVDNSGDDAGDSGGAVTTIRGEAQTTCGVWLETNASTDVLVLGLLHGGMVTVSA